MFRLRVLGGFALEGAGGVAVPTLPHRRAMATLAVLAVAGDLGCTRERLLALLWPESDEHHARHGLRDALHAIRHALAPEAVRSVNSHLQLDRAIVSDDVTAFTQAMAAGRFADAVRAYGGQLLDGFHIDGAVEFDHWLSAERARLERECIEALEGLAAAAERAGDWADAVRWWGRALEHDPLNSAFVLRHLQAMTSIGDRANAVQAGELHVRRLREEFGLEPDPAILARITGIRNGQCAALSPEPARPPATAADNAAMRAVPEPAAPAAATAHAVPATPRRSSRRWIAWAAGIAALAIAAPALRRAARTPDPRPAVAHPRSSVAVLPFRNLSADGANAWLVLGLHDELLAQLAKVSALRVVAPSSADGSAPADVPSERLVREMGVGSVVRASVQVQGKRMRVLVRLEDPATGASLWAETYERTLDDAFAVQRDIAERIVGAVGVTVSRAEAGGLAAVPTASTEAYLLYLQGLAYARRPGDRREDLAIAQDLLERSLRADSAFALAHAALSRVHGTILSRRYDASPARAEAQRREAAAALRFGPDLPEAHVAAALASCCGRRSDRQTLDEYRAAARRTPDDAALWGEISLLHARLGEWDSVDATFERAVRLDPRDANHYQAQGNRLHCRRRYPEAIAMYRRAMALAPDYPQPHIALAWSYLLWKGELDTLRTVLAAAADTDPGGGAPRTGLEQAIVLTFERRPDSILALLRTLRGDAWTSGESVEYRTLLSGSAHLMRGDTAAALAAFDSAAVLLDAALRDRPGDISIHAARAMTMAQLGRRAAAHRELRWLERTDEYRNNRNCSMVPEGRAMVLARLGEVDSAVAAADRLLAGYARISVQTLRLDPVWDPIRADPRFQALLTRYADRVEIARR